MPYTVEEIHNTSRFIARERSYYGKLPVSSWSIRHAVWMLQNYERDSKWAIEVALYAESTIKCEGCGEVCAYTDKHGEVHDRYPDEVVVFDGMTFCKADCAYDDGYDYCQRCGEWMNADYMVDIEENGRYCSDYCAERDGWTHCDHCNEWVHENDSYTVGDESWCESCASEDSLCCCECGHLYNIDDMCQTSMDDWYCEDCRSSVNDCNDLESWTEYPRIRLFGASDQPHLGTELETDGDCRYEYASTLDGLDGFCKLFWMGDDGSLSDEGVEIKSQPMTLAYHEKIRELYDKIGETAEFYGYKSHDLERCGLHISIDREWFGKSPIVQDVHIFKLMRLTQRFERQFTTFSRRLSNYYCKYATNQDYSPCKSTKVDVKNTLGYWGDRGIIKKSREFARHEDGEKFRAVNICHSSHVEIRIFRGTLRWSTYFASLALVDGLARVVKLHSSEWAENVNWYDLMSEVIEAVKSGGNQYSADCLENYLGEKGLL